MTAGAQFLQGKIHFGTVLRWVLLGSKQQSGANEGLSLGLGRVAKISFATSDFFCHEWWGKGSAPGATPIRPPVLISYRVVRLLEFSILAYVT